MTSEQLRQFKMAAECLNLTKAAEKLYITQPALSITIGKLEEELATKLFIRDGRKITLTKEGEVLLKYANIVCDAIDRATDYITAKADTELIKAYRIGGTAINLITEGCYDSQQHRLNCILKVNSELPSLIDTITTDIVIADERYMTGKTAEDLEKVFLFSQQLLLSADKDDEIAKHDTLTLEELKEQPLVGYSNPVGIESWISEVQNDNHIELNEVLTMDHLGWFSMKGKLPWPYLMSSFGASAHRTFFKDRKLIPVIGKYTERDIYLWYNPRKRKNLEPIVEIIVNNAKTITAQDKRFYNSRKK